MQISDIQDTNKTSPDTLELMTRVIEKEKPDLIVFSGDQINGFGLNFLTGDKHKKVRQAIENILGPVTKAKIPFTYVYGNHDDDSFSISKEEQLKIYQENPLCLAYNADDSIEGYCNHNLIVKDQKGKDCLNIYLIDSLSMSVQGDSPPVSESQIDWYRKTRDSLKKENGRYIPSIVFQHIPVPEVYELIARSGKKTKGSVKGYDEYAGYYTLDKSKCRNPERSFLGESPAAPVENSGEFEALRECGDVFALFFGHDHKNSFVANLRGIDLGYTQGIGFNVYGPDLKRGVRIFDFDEKNPAEYETYTVTAEDFPDFTVQNKSAYTLYKYAPASIKAVTEKVKIGLAVGAVAGAAYLLYKKLK